MTRLRPALPRPNRRDRLHVLMAHGGTCGTFSSAFSCCAGCNSVHDCHPETRYTKSPEPHAPFARRRAVAVERSRDQGRRRAG